MTRILITGASGFLGHNLAVCLGRHHEIFAGYCTAPPDDGTGTPVRFDVADAGAVLGQTRKVRPELVVHAAAMSRPDECERTPDRALEVIVAGTRNIAEACARISARLVHISTDLVFDGKRGRYTESDAVHGISVYARAKIQAERIVSETSPSSVILRVALLYGVGSTSHPGSVVEIVRAWHEGRTLTFYTDQFRTPVFAPEIAEIVQRILEHSALRGVFHAGGPDRISRFELALALAERAGIPPELVRPVSMQDSQAAAPRGADCSLVSEKLRQSLGISFMSNIEALDFMLREGLFDYS